MAGLLGMVGKLAAGGSGASILRSLGRVASASARSRGSERGRSSRGSTRSREDDRDRLGGRQLSVRDLLEAIRRDTTDIADALDRGALGGGKPGTRDGGGGLGSSLLSGATLAGLMSTAFMSTAVIDAVAKVLGSDQLKKHVSDIVNSWREKAAPIVKRADDAARSAGDAVGKAIDSWQNMNSSDPFALTPEEKAAGGKPLLWNETSSPQRAFSGKMDPIARASSTDDAWIKKLAEMLGMRVEDRRGEGPVTPEIAERRSRPSTDPLPAPSKYWTDSVDAMADRLESENLDFNSRWDNWREVQYEGGRYYGPVTEKSFDESKRRGDPFGGMGNPWLRGYKNAEAASKFVPDGRQGARVVKANKIEFKAKKITFELEGSPGARAQKAFGEISGGFSSAGSRPTSAGEWAGAATGGVGGFSGGGQSRVVGGEGRSPYRDWRRAFLSEAGAYSSGGYGGGYSGTNYAVSPGSVPGDYEASPGGSYGVGRGGGYGGGSRRPVSPRASAAAPPPPVYAGSAGLPKSRISQSMPLSVGGGAGLPGPVGGSLGAGGTPGFSVLGGADAEGTVSLAGGSSLPESWASSSPDMGVGGGANLGHYGGYEGGRRVSTGVTGGGEIGASREASYGGAMGLASGVGTSSGVVDPGAVMGTSGGAGLEKLGRSIGMSGDKFGGAEKSLVGGATVPNSPEVLAALNEVARARGIDPAALAGVINTESNWRTGAVTGNYRGLSQIGAETFREAGGTLAGMSYDQFLRAGPAEQVRAYGAWLDHYKFGEKMERAGVDLSRMSPAQQAAVLQGFQFGPNATSWQRALGSGDASVPTTSTKQASFLGDKSIETMTGYYERLFASNKPVYDAAGGVGAEARLTGQPAPGYNATAMAALSMPGRELSRDMEPTPPRPYERRTGEPGEFNAAAGGQWGGPGENIQNFYLKDGQKFQANSNVGERYVNFFNEMIDRGYPVNVSSEGAGGYNLRGKRGGGGYSMHAYGAAVDMNVPSNAFRGRTTDLPEAAEALAWRHGLSWGGRFGDPMHWEAMSDAAWASKRRQLAEREMLKAAERAANSPAAPSATPSSPEEAARGFAGAMSRESGGGATPSRQEAATPTPRVPSAEPTSGPDSMQEERDRKLASTPSATPVPKESETEVPDAGPSRSGKGDGGDTVEVRKDSSSSETRDEEPPKKPDMPSPEAKSDTYKKINEDTEKGDDGK